MDEHDVREKLKRFYQKHNPEKEGDIDKVMKLLVETEMTEHQLFDQLCKKYGVLYDPLEWKAPVIGKGTVNGASVELSRGDTIRKEGRGAGSAGMGMDSVRSSTREASPSSTTPVQSQQQQQHVDPVNVMDHEEARRKKLETFYKRHNPTKLGDIENILKLADDSTDEEIFSTLCKKYNLKKSSVFIEIGLEAPENAPPSSASRHADLKDQLQGVKNKDEGEEILRKEFAEWLSQTMNLNPPVTEANLFSKLADGVLLCRLLNLLNPALKVNFASRPVNIWQKLDNVKRFIELAETEFGIPKEQLFDPQDLVEDGRDKRQVMTFFIYIAKRAHQIFSTFAPQIVKLELEIDQEDEVEISHKEVEEMLKTQIKTKQVDEEAIRKAEEERQRQLRQEEAEARQREADRKAREEAYERERRRKHEEMERLKRERRYAEEQRLREEEARRMEMHRRRNAAEEEEERRRLAERQARIRAECLEEDNPVFQYKGNQYVSDRRDPLDRHVGRIVNSLPSRPLAVKLHKVKNGMYVIEYPKRIVFYVRCVRDAVMIRVGGGWVTLEEFLFKRLRDYPENNPVYVNRYYDRQETVAVLHHRNKAF